MRNLSRRNQIIFYVIAIILVLSMLLSAIVAFSPTPQNTQNLNPTVTQQP
jgi:hypothetical protein